MLREIVIDQFENSAGKVQDIRLSFQFFGNKPTEAPVVLVNHALTGNSEVTGEFGWWKDLIGEDKCIDLRKYCVLAINIPGNGYKGHEVFKEYKDFKLKDIARLQAKVLEKLNIDKLYAIIGGSIGGALAWELAVLKPALAKHIIPVATDFKATDWLVANCRIQEHILNNSSNPVHDARMHAMTFYRTPQSLAQKFENKKNEGKQVFEVENWLLHHGEKLKNRFNLDSYKFLNHLLTTIDISGGKGDHIQYAGQIKGHIHIVTVNSDLFFLAEENRKAYKGLSRFKPEVSYYEIDSIHGHDAFLIETEQLVRFLKPVFEIKEDRFYGVAEKRNKVLSLK
ncbi:alpha/beta fold hydrolase [Christiangramia salexigens]|uniref:Homoserine acetyltransferase n=1 Tax=Christiangramia salexigens TaxID=1913577 RepID=A0A1L3J586_9FLAO|nr:alpha/beta fold hydrolase [Christiangramia salexigens]APG60286.1 homoserine acetyltransferase [Christiangramia salexigens]